LTASGDVTSKRAHENCVKLMNAIRLCRGEPQVIEV
jgi:hypothetical protein